jgi:EAL domain-containing protein (putative c-di-GMP-specific phosphodiesterase class I)
MMANAIASAASRLMQIVKGGATGQPGRDRSRAVLVLRVENRDLLCTSLGPALLDRMMEMMALRLTSELRFLPQDRFPGQAELCGPMLRRRTGALPGLLAQLGVICRSDFDLGDIRVTPVVNAVIVGDERGEAELQALYRFGREALAACSPLTPTGQIRFVEYPDGDGLPLGGAEPLFAADQIALRYQPQICCDTGALVALAVVAEVMHPELGRLDFEDVAPRLGREALADCARLILRQALAALAGWDRLGRSVPFVSVSLSDRELADPGLADALLWELDRLDMAPDRIEIEVTEPLGRVGGRVPVTSTLQRLAAAGCRIAVGNFGQASAGLDDLRSFCVGRVRIGRSFVAGCDHRADQQRMILAILALAEHLRLKTLADGVLNLEEKSFLSQIGFNAVQGRAVSPPLTASETDDLLLRHDDELPRPFSLKRKA